MWWQYLVKRCAGSDVIVEPVICIYANGGAGCMDGKWLLHLDGWLLHFGGLGRSSRAAILAAITAGYDAVVKLPFS